MAALSFEDFLLRRLPQSCSGTPAIIGVPKSRKSHFPSELEVRLKLTRAKGISGIYLKYTHNCPWNERPISSDEIKTLARDFAGGPDDVRIAGEVINDSTTSMLRCRKPQREYLGEFDISIYRDRYDSGSVHHAQDQYCMKDLLKAVFGIVGISYQINDQKGLLTVSPAQTTLNLTPEALSEAYQLMYERGFMPVWIDGSLRDEQSGENLRRFSVHNHFYRCGEGKDPLFSKTILVELNSGDGRRSLSEDKFRTLESALERQGFERSNFNYHYLSAPPMTIVD